MHIRFFFYSKESKFKFNVLKLSKIDKIKNLIGMRYEWGVNAPYLLKNEHHKIRLRENEIKNYNRVI